MHKPHGHFKRGSSSAHDLASVEECSPCVNPFMHGRATSECQPDLPNAEQEQAVARHKRHADIADFTCEVGFQCASQAMHTLNSDYAESCM